MRKRKTSLHRFMAFLLSVVMIMSSYSPVFAAEETPVSTSEEENLEVSEITEELEEPPEQSEKEAVYTLYLTHYFRFTVNGEGRSVSEEQTLQLTEQDFEDGACSLARFAYYMPQLTVTEANPVSLDAFDENRMSGARIVYAVSPGWKLVPTSGAGNEGTALKDVFQGQLSDYEFVPANVVRVHMEYKYSSTGGLAGIDAAEPEILEALPEKNADGNYEFELALPTKEGFRIVLNPAPLNEYLVAKPRGDETQEQLHQMWQNGSFSGDIANKCIYEYQAQNGIDAEPDYAIQNQTYGNRYSDEYNQAWNQARILKVDGDAGYTAAAICGTENTDNQTDEDRGANALTNPRLKVTLTEKQLQNVMANGLNISISYRRNATWYTVNHWVPVQLSGLTDEQIASMTQEKKGDVTYVLLNVEREQGRVGGLTRAAAKTGEIYDLLVPLNFSQRLIANEQQTDGNIKGTIVNIYYKEAESYRVIFNTDNTYIPRQQIALGSAVDFTNVSAPTRKGYTFGGWQYLKKDARPDENGVYDSSAYVPIEKSGNSSYTLTLDSKLISQKAKLQETDGVPVLHLYPIWKADETQVTVILWTEDLTGVDDVQAVASENGNPSYYNEKYKEYQNAPVTHKPDLTGNNANYSNAGSFTMNVPTGSSLVADDRKDILLKKIQDKVTEAFDTSVGEVTGIPANSFYTQDSFAILHENGGSMDYTTTTANADGNTMIYVYFTRNLYTLKFHYYGTAFADKPSDYCVANGTNGFSHSDVKNFIKDGELIFSYGGDSNVQQNTYMRPENISDEKEMPVPKYITIKAKYGADLRGVWPAAQNEEHMDVTLWDASSAIGDMISWAATQGKYRNDGLPNSGSSHAGESTIMGLYATMDAEIIADPTKPDTVHHLVAYWSQCDVDYYRYNHCYELPGLDFDAINGVKTISLYGDSGELKNTLYLVPADTEDITKFGFIDLMEVSYNTETGKVTYGVENGGYYAVRGYETDGVIRYYAVARQLETVSTNTIEKQNPSARAHMIKVNQIADHTEEYLDTDGMSWVGSVCGTKDNPYDLYFYYDRERYKISYMAPISGTNSSMEGSEVELGHIDLPFGAYVTENAYAFQLNYEDTNQATDNQGNHKYLWSYPTEADGTTIKAPVAVCPDRNKDGKAVWRFKGWGLGPAGVNMQWEAKQESASVPQAQTEADFYIDSDLRLYAIWEAPTLTVTFHLNGGQVNSRDSIEVKVPANTVYTTVGTIPRPVRNGYTFVGWYKSDENGAPIGTKPEDIFSFDTVIIEDQHVAAVWTTTIIERYSYTVYYVTPKLIDGADPGKYDTVKINAQTGSIDENGGETYYVLKKEEYKDQIYMSDLVVNLTAKLQAGYVPRETNKMLDVDQPGAGYNAIFIYDPQTTGSYTVRFVEAGTENIANPHVVKTLLTEADQMVVTPGMAAVTELNEKGYELVNKGADGNYAAVENYENLTWLDKNGKIYEMSTLREEAIPDTVTYLVQPVMYTITYQNASGSPAAAEEALAVITAAENIPISSAGNKNPTQYTVKNQFALKNPARVYDSTSGKWYQFSYWSLGEGTMVNQELRTGERYTRLSVDKGTVGRLTFVANWEESKDEPDKPGTSEKPNKPGTPDKPEKSGMSNIPETPKQSKSTSTPLKTGDETAVNLWLAMLGISCIGIIAALAMYRWLYKEKRHKH